MNFSWNGIRVHLLFTDRFTLSFSSKSCRVEFLYCRLKSFGHMMCENYISNHLNRFLRLDWNDCIISSSLHTDVKCTNKFVFMGWIIDQILFWRSTIACVSPKSSQRSKKKGSFLLTLFSQAEKTTFEFSQNDKKKAYFFSFLLLLLRGHSSLMGRNRVKFVPKDWEKEKKHLTMASSLIRFDSISIIEQIVPIPYLVFAQWIIIRMASFFFVLNINDSRKKLIDFVVLRER